MFVEHRINFCLKDEENEFEEPSKTKMSKKQKKRLKKQGFQLPTYEPPDESVEDNSDIEARLSGLFISYFRLVCT